MNTRVTPPTERSPSTAQRRPSVVCLKWTDPILHPEVVERTSDGMPYRRWEPSP